MTIFTKGIDVSAYQINVPWKSLVDNAGLGFAVIKGDQLTATDNHIALAREAGVPVVGEYFWNDPTITASVQIEWFAKDIKDHKPDFIALDVEQYWAVWQDYWDYLNGKITQAAIRKKSPSAISENARTVADGLHKLFPELPMVIYTGTWFVLGYAQPMVGWVGKYDIWMAHYFDGKLGIRNVTWDVLNATPPQNFTVWMPLVTMIWKIWQYSSTMITPAQNARYDWNAFAGTLQELKTWAKKILPGPTLEEQVEKLTNQMEEVLERLDILERR